MQPVAELSELSQRGGLDGRQIELAAANIQCGTLRRSGSSRFHQNTVNNSYNIYNLSLSYNILLKIMPRQLDIFFFFSGKYYKAEK